MEPPPLSTPIPTTTTTTTTAPPPPLPQLNYPNSLDSSPRSRKTNSWEEPPYGPTTTATATTKLRLMCSYGGRIVPRPHDKSLCYVGGDTRIIVVDRLTNLSDLQFRLSKSLLNGKPFTLKYQLPSEDLDSLISVTTDEDLENMVEEYDRILHSSNPTSKTFRLRLFLFPPSLDSENSSSIESILEGSKNHQDWFFTALNWNSSACKERAFSDTSSVNCLLGLDDSVQIPAGKSDEIQIEASGSMKSGGKASNSAHDVQSVPGSPLLETTSSFGSSSSSPSTANSPPIKVHHVEEGANPKGVVSGLGIEEQFQQMNFVGCGGIKNQEEAPAAAVVSGLPVVVGGEYPNPVLSDDEKSDQCFPVGFRKSPQLQQQQLAPHGKPPSGFDLPSPDSVSSDISVTNMQKPVVYQEQTAHIQSGNGMNLGNQIGTRDGDIARMQMQQVQFDQYQQLHQQQQFVPAGAQYIQHHQPGTMPVYYSVYPPQQQLSHPHGIEHPYPVYFMPTRQGQAYNLPPPQPSYSESPHAVPSKPDLASGVYRTPTAPAPQVMQVPSSQSAPQYAGFPQIYHHQPQAMNHSAATRNHAYEFTDPAHAHVYYTQPFAPQLATQYQTMSSQAPAATLSDASPRLSAEKN